MCKGMKLEIVDLWIRVYGKKSINCINILYKLYKHSINWKDIPFHVGLVQNEH